MKIEMAMAALFARLSTLKPASPIAGEVQHVSRRLEHVNDWETSLMPALFQHETRISVESVKNNPRPKNRMYVEWYVYVPGAEGADHSGQLNVFIEDMAALLRPDSPIDSACTLGGVVTNVYIEGDIEIFEGVLHDRAVAIVPLTVVMPGY